MRTKFHVIQAKLIMSVWCFTVHCYITQLQIRHNLCLRLLNSHRRTRLATPPFVISHFTKVLFLTRKFHPCLFFSTPFISLYQKFAYDGNFDLEDITNYIIIIQGLCLYYRYDFMIGPTETTQSAQIF